MLNKIAVVLIKLYQYIVSPLLPNSCRFYPPCSSYSLSVFRTFPFLQALLLSLRRILRCHPFYPGGYDPPPNNKDKDHG